MEDKVMPVVIEEEDSKLTNITQVNQSAEQYEVNIETPEFDAKSNDITMDEIVVGETTGDAVETVEIEVEEAMGWAGGDNTRHDSLTGRDEENQHPIQAIVGLRDILDRLGALKTVYSDKLNIANFYEWKDAAYDDYGYFVSFVPGESTIKICNGSDVFGVSVKSAGFVGGQGTSVPRDKSYGLIVTSGLVDVRCELDVKVGDYVISNNKGYAKKSDSGYGYKVFATEKKDGVKCATIMLGVQADIVNALGAYLNEVKDQADANDKNVVSAINLANQAYNKANEIEVSNQDMSIKVDGALGKVDGMATEVENLSAQVSNSTLISAQAKAIAESAATSAESMKNEAVEKANEALADTSKLRKELEDKVVEIDIALDNTMLELQAAKESVEATRDELQSDIDNISTELNNTKTELNNTVSQLQKDVDGVVGELEGIKTDVDKVKDDISADIDAINKDLGKTKESLSATKEELSDSIKGNKESIESISQEIEPLATWSDGTQTGTAGFVARANNDSTTLAGIVTWQGETNESIAGFKQEVSDTYATIESVTSLKSETSEAIAGVKQEASETYATIESVTSLETETSKAIAGVKQEVADTYATIDSVTALETQASEAIAGVKQEATETYATIESVATLETNTSNAISAVKQTADNNKAQLDVVSSFTYTDEDGNTSTGLAGLKSQVSDNAAELSTVANYETDDAKGLAGLMAQIDKNKAEIALLSQFVDGDIEGLAGLKAQVDANTAELEVIASHTYTDADGNVLKGLAAINQQVTDQGADIDSIVSWQGTTNTAIAGIEQKANDNAGNISILTEWKSDVESDVSSIASIKAQSDANKSSIEELTTWKGTASESLASVKQQSDANKASIDAITLWQGETTESIAEVRQQADDNASSIESLTSWKDDTTETISTIEQTTSAHESSINSLTSWQGEAQTSIANVEQKAGANESKINSLTSWQGEASESIANVEQKATDNEAAITSLTTWKGEATESISTIQQTANQNSADISLIASWKSDVEDDVSSIASIKTTADANKASIEQLVKKDTELSTAIAGVKTIADANEASIEQITAWQDKVNPTINSVAGIKQTADGNAAKIEGLTSWQGDTNTAMARIEQKADANGAYIQSTVANIDKYAVGPYSQAYGFTLEQATSVLEEGMIYVPTSHENLEAKTTYHTEEYKNDVNAPTSPRTFVPWYLYQWGKIGDHYGWITVDKNNDPIKYDEAAEENKMNTAGCAVYFSSQIVPDVTSNPQYGYWYTDGDTSTGSASDYEPYTLYKWDLPYKYQTKDENGEVKDVDKYHWVAVATLAGNSSNRAISQIRQSTNEIVAEVTNAYGSVAGFGAKLSATEASVQQIALWKEGEEEKMASVSTKADADGGPGVVISALEKNGEDVAAVASLTLGIVKDENDEPTGALCIDANNVNFNADNFTIDASHIDFSGDEFNSVMEDVIARNLILSSGTSREVYHDVFYYLAKKPEVGVQYTMSIKATVGENHTRFAIMNGLGVVIGPLTIFNVGEKGEDKMYTSTFTWKNMSGNSVADDMGIWIIMDMTSNSPTIIKQIKLEKGNKATEWTAAPEDTNHIVSTINQTKEGIVIAADKLDLKGLVTVEGLQGDGTTVINGSNITTGRIESADYSYSSGYYAEDGMAIDLDDKYIRSKNFVIESDGTARLGAGYIGGLTVNDKGLFNVSSDTLGIYSGEVDNDDTLNYLVASLVDKGQRSPVRFYAGIGEKYDLPGSKTLTGSGKVDSMSKIGSGSLSWNSTEVTGARGKIRTYEIDPYNPPVVTTTFSKSVNRTVNPTYTNGMYEWSYAIRVTLPSNKYTVSVNNVSGSYTTDVRTQNARDYIYTVTFSQSATMNHGSVTFRGTVLFTRVDYDIDISVETKDKTYTFSWSVNNMDSPASVIGVDRSSIKATLNLSYTYNFGVDAGTELAKHSTLILDDGSIYTKAISVSNELSITGSGHIDMGDCRIAFGNGRSYIQRWTSVDAKLNGTWYAGDNLITDSYRNAKYDIESLTDKYSILFDNLVPRRFKYYHGESERYHTGLILDELKDAMDAAGLDSSEVAAYCITNQETGEGGIRYEELISLCVGEIQKLKNRIVEFEKRLEKMESYDGKTNNS